MRAPLSLFVIENYIIKNKSSIYPNDQLIKAFSVDINQKN